MQFEARLKTQAGINMYKPFFVFFFGGGRYHFIPFLRGGTAMYSVSSLFIRLKLGVHQGFDMVKAGSTRTHSDRLFSVSS